MKNAILFVGLTFLFLATQGTLATDTSIPVGEYCLFDHPLPCVDKAQVCSDTGEITLMLRNNAGYQIAMEDIGTGNCTILDKSFPRLVNNNEAFKIKLTCRDIREGTNVLDITIR